MLSLCEPYGPRIACLCDKGEGEVLRCFLTGEGGDEEGLRDERVGGRDEGRAEDDLCGNISDVKTEVVLSVTLILLILLLIFW